jgi:DMSO/TMAO reductase YedYZ molybdopterin-dependent catalytic subunit
MQSTGQTSTQELSLVPMHGSAMTYAMYFLGVAFGVRSIMIRLVPMTPRRWGERGRRRATKLGIDPARLPPGQSPTTKFPVLAVGPNPHVPLASWTLSVHGEADAPYALDWGGLMALDQVDVTCDIHCVTRWSKFDTRWRGVRVRTLLERAEPRPGASHVMVHSHGGYTTNVPLDALLDDDALVAHSFDGAPLAPDHGGPARLLVPSRYFWKSAKFVRALELMAGDRPGFWEDNGYHNDGDPWREERHSVDPYTARGLRRSARDR